MARWTNLTPDFLNSQYLLGGRVFGRWALLPDIYVKPSLGFFGRYDGRGSVSETQFVGEGGANVEWAFYNDSRAQLYGGLAQRLDLTWGSISVYDYSSPTPLAVRYRLGPTAGMLYNFDRSFGVMVNLEATFTMTMPVNFFYGLTAGFTYHLF